MSLFVSFFASVFFRFPPLGFCGCLEEVLARPGCLPAGLRYFIMQETKVSFVCPVSSLRKTINHSPCCTMSSRIRIRLRKALGSSDNKNVSFSHTKQITCRQSEVSFCRPNSFPQQLSPLNPRIPLGGK